MGLTFSTDYRYVCSTCIQNCGGLYQIKEKTHHSKIQKDGLAKYIPDYAFIFYGNILEEHMETKIQI